MNDDPLTEGQERGESDEGTAIQAIAHWQAVRDLDTTRPFLTEDLLKLRVEQRRLRANLPDWLIERIERVRPKKPPAPPFQAARAEWAVRVFAKGRIEQIPDVIEYVARGVAYNVARDIDQYLSEWTRAITGDRSLVMPGDPLASMGAHFYKQEEDVVRDPVDPKAELPLYAILREITSLLDLADVLAGDGYWDGRDASVP